AASDIGQLTAIRRFWSRTDLDFATRTAILSGRSGNALYVLGIHSGPLLNGTTVGDDNDVDVLYGDNTGTNIDIGFDWYILNGQGGTKQDLIKDLTDATELLALLDIES